MSCPICHADDSAPVAGPQRRWRYQRCRVCEHRWLYPIPEQRELTEHYNTFYSVPREFYIAEVGAKAPELERMIAAISPTPGRMLEIGCSYGALLDAFRAIGWDVDGVEIDARAAEYAREAYGLHVVAGTLEDTASALRPPYDVIMMHHVLEHVTDPVAFCRLVRTLMRPGGTFVVRTPNAASTASRLASGWWEWALAPEHVHLFSPKSLDALLRHTGFDLRVVVTRRGDAEPTPYGLLHASVRRLIGAKRRGPTAMADAGAPAPPALRTKRWYVTIDRAIRAVMTPANLGFAAAARLGIVTESELFVAANAGASAPVTR